MLLVEHDIDRVFALADRVTVMNEGRVLVDGTADDARDSRAVQEIYIGTGTAALAASARGHDRADRGRALLTLDRVDTYYGKSHILREASLVVHEQEIVALLGRNGAGKSTLLKTIIGIAARERRPDRARATTICASCPPPPSRGSASATCRRAAGCSRA